MRLGGRSDGGWPRRLGVRAGTTRDRPETPVAIEAGLALGREGVRGMVAESPAYCQRTLGWCLEQRVGLSTRVPRPGTGRQDLEAWGPRPAALPWWLDTPGRTRQESPRRWHGQRVWRRGEVASSAGRVALEALRWVVVHAHQVAQRAALTAGPAPTHAAERVAEHRRRGAARRGACAADAEAALADDAGRGQGRRGRWPRPWRAHGLRSRVEACQQRQKRARRGCPPQAAQPQAEVAERWGVERMALERATDEQGGCVLAPTGGAEGWADAEVVQA